VVWWNLERPTQDPTTSASIDKLRGLVHAIWVSDELAAKRDARFTYRFMASHEAIATRSRERLYAVCHLSYLWGRRETCVNELKRRKIPIAPQAYGRVDQDRVVAKSRIMLNLHQYADAPLAAPLRFAVAAAYAIPIVSELLENCEAISKHGQPGPYAEAAIHKIPDLLEELLARDDDKLGHYGQLLHHRFCVATNFRHEVEQGAAAL
jgi:hypothetical protein